MKRILPIFLVCLLLLLTACSGQQMTSNDYHFQISFPDDMTVFSPIETKADDPRLAPLGISAEELSAFGENNGLFYAVRVKDGVRDEMTVTVEPSEYSQDLWQLTESDAVAITTFEDDMKETFEAMGFQVKHKGILNQKDACCVFMTAASGKTEGIDLIFMATVYNGLYYAITYRSSHAISDQVKQDVYETLGTFYITESLPNPNASQTDDTVAKAILVIVLILIAAILFGLALRLLLVRRPKHQEEEQPYVPQFSDQFNRKTKDKK